MGWHDFATRLRAEHGSVIVTAGIMALSFVLLGAVIVEVGQWFEHRRAIQTRADAAALAGGQELAQCFNVGVNGVKLSDVETLIESWAQSYGGIAGGALGSTTYNPQFGKSSSDLMWFQSNTFPSAGQTNTRGLGSECASGNLMLDVKMTQAGIPPLFSISPFAAVHGWARVQLQEIASETPTMPLAIPDVRPHNVAVTFVDASGNALTGCSTPDGSCVFQLTGPTPSAGVSGQLNGWDATVTIPMPAANSNVGMRVGIGSWSSADNGSCAGVNYVQTSTANYVCYDYSTTGKASTAGIIDLRSYDNSTAGSASAPVLRQVDPTNTCSGSPFFSIDSAPSGTCNAGVNATVDFGGSPPQNAQVEATINNTLVSLTNTTGNQWGLDSVPLPIEGGPYPVTMGWCVRATTCTSKQLTPFNGGKPVQQIFSGSDNSSAILPGGPIFAATIAAGNAYTYSFEANKSATFSVHVGLAGGVHLPVRTGANCTGSGPTWSCPTDPPVLLRFTTGSGNDSLTYAVDCGTIPGNTGGTLYQQIQYGCANAFSLNTVDLCPDPSNPTPTDCAPVQTGAATGQVQQALNARFAPGGVCSKNYYPTPGMYGTPPKIPASDPRAVTLIITDFSAFIGSGGSSSSDVPVVTFASFYITGWDGAPSSCTNSGNPYGNEPAPPTDSKNGQGSNIWGHFITDVDLGGTPNGKTCPGASVTPCVPALVR